MDHTQIADEVLSVPAHDHELRLPQFLVVGDLVVVGLTLTNLEDASVAVKANGQVLDLLGVHSFEVQVKFVSGSLVRGALEWSPLKVNIQVELSWRKFSKTD